MAPSKAAAAKDAAEYAKDQKVLCFHGNLMYEAKVLDVRTTKNTIDEPVWQYKIHYKGWKNSWDDWVHGDRIKPFTEENEAIANMLKDKAGNPSKKTKGLKNKGGAGPNGSEFSSTRDSEERHASVAAPSGRGRGRNRDFDLESEENFLSRPSVKLVLPDHLKALLVDDWENVTKNQALVPLPSPKSVNNILEEYTAFEMKNRIPGSHQADLLEEVTAGLREYFDSCLGKLLLYRFERYQYFEIREAWNSSTDDLGGKKPSDTYGAEHLCRLLAILPELIAQTNMDQQSVNRLREELTKFTAWLGKNTAVYFANEYETPNQEYIDKARGV